MQFLNHVWPIWLIDSLSFTNWVTQKTVEPEDYGDYLTKLWIINEKLSRGNWKSLQLARQKDTLSCEASLDNAYCHVISFELLGFLFQWTVRIYLFINRIRSRGTRTCCVSYDTVPSPLPYVRPVCHGYRSAKNKILSTEYKIATLQRLQLSIHIFFPPWVFHAIFCRFYRSRRKEKYFYGVPQMVNSSMHSCFIGEKFPDQFRGQNQARNIV